MSARWGGTAALALVLAAAAVLPQAVALRLYPGMSPVLDAAVYTRQADALAEGDLAIPGDQVTARTRPFFTTEREDRWVFKYLPGTAALLAAGRAVTGSWRPAAAAACALLALAAWGLCRSLGGSPRAAVLAAAVVALSPMTLTLGGLPLSYVPAAALAAAGAWAAAEAERGNRPALRVVAGGLFGAALWCRQLEVVAALAVVVAWVAVTRRRAGRPVAPALAAVGAGLVPFAAGIAVFDWVYVGAPWRLPFSLTPSDTLGFGTRRVLPGAPAYEYGPGEAWDGLRLGLGSFATWVVAPLAVLAAAAWAAARRRVRWPLPVALAAAVPVAMLAFWGSWYVVSDPGLSIYDRVGPFYLVAALAPVAALAGAGLDGWLGARRGPLLVAAAVVAAVAVQAFPLAHRLDLVGEEQDQWVAFADRLDELTAGGALVLVDADHLDAPFEDLRRLDPGPGPDYVTADPADTDLAGIAALADGRPLVRATVEVGSLSNGLLVGRPEATPVDLAAGPALTASLRVTPPPGATAVTAVVRAGGDEAAVPVPVAPSSLELAATPAGLSLATGGGTATVPLPDGPTLAEVAVRVTVPGEPERVATTRVPVDRPAPGEVRWLVPAPVAESVGGGPEVRFSLVLGWPAPPPPGPSRPGG
jgi:hypothetical protein